MTAINLIAFGLLASPTSFEDDVIRQYDRLVRKKEVSKFRRIEERYYDWRVDESFSTAQLSIEGPRYVAHSAIMTSVGLGRMKPRAVDRALQKLLSPEARSKWKPEAQLIWLLGVGQYLLDDKQFSAECLRLNGLGIKDPRLDSVRFTHRELAIVRAAGVSPSAVAESVDRRLRYAEMHPNEIIFVVNCEAWLFNLMIASKRKGFPWPTQLLNRFLALESRTNQNLQRFLNDPKAKYGCFDSTRNLIKKVQSMP